ncbi:response regulator [Aequorivita vladivostokensis]|uniref:Histidine kinase n=1 Tax=Aequorivita vladivostokensis TaxID=171194 RepID=A0ABR5DGH3_9FLAO|nr:response regulator [Aequorivita vladivostokensis]MAB58639.1 response regulator [Aequorivita sp.]KJJ37872.1 histidine kinase [Aequorivita vladivostokensis]MBF31154.1 response regulator [Aequorivita sp.]HAV53914.1 response regulator [Aequorivita sp.]HBL80021.1 response regulator [Aequorivita sp.]|tara:strand:+ start:12702 stop:13115 length:414 start_codon:yes stop_codon:yes gene_type:complete
MGKLKNVLLIDDSESDNFYHARKIKKMGITDNIHICYSGEEALDYLKSELEGIHPQPTLIFLDINMPGMNGWEFLEEYEQLEVSQKGEVVLTMLSNSIDERDRERAQQYKSVHGFYSKPLNEEYLANILQTYFSQYL